MLSPRNGTMTMMACDTEKLTHWEIYTWRCSHSYRRKKNSAGFCFHFSRACYILIHWKGNTTASFEKIILFIKELDLINENHHRYFGFICFEYIAPTYGYSLCFQTAMSCIFLSFSLGDVCKKAIIQLEIFSNSKLSNL